MKLPKLNQSGIAHILAPLLFIVIFAGIGAYLLTHSKAATVTDSGEAAPIKKWQFTIDSSSADSGASSTAGTSVSSGAAQRALGTSAAYPRCGPLQILFLFGIQEPPGSPVITGYLDALLKPKAGVEVNSYLTNLRVKNSAADLYTSQRTPPVLFLGFYNIGFRFELPVSAAMEDPEFTFTLEVNGKIGSLIRCQSVALDHGVVVEEPL